MLKIVFMGTPGFAVPSLDILHHSHHEVVGCVTAPDRPAGRGRKLKSSEVKDYCLQNNIKILQPVKLRDEEFINELKSFNADIFIIVAFRMLPKIIWSIPKKGSINLHASLLPEYRGAAPINWAIINGEQKSGLTTFYLNEKIDTGNILLQEEIEIYPNDNFGTLHNKMMILGSSLLLKTIDNIDNIEIRSQNLIDDKHNNAPKLNRENTKINWYKSNIEIHNHIRGLNPFPGAWTKMKLNTNEIIFKILETELVDVYEIFEAGSFKKINPKELYVYCGKGGIKIVKAQLQGKKVMNMNEILRGYDDQFSTGKFIF